MKYSLIIIKLFILINSCFGLFINNPLKSIKLYKRHNNFICYNNKNNKDNKIKIDESKLLKIKKDKEYEYYLDKYNKIIIFLYIFLFINIYFCICLL